MLFNNNSLVKDRLLYKIENGFTSIKVQYNKYGDYYEVEMLIQGSDKVEVMTYSFHQNEQEAIYNVYHLQNIIKKWTEELDVQLKISL